MVTYREEELQGRISSLLRLEVKTRNSEYKRILESRRGELEQNLSTERNRTSQCPPIVSRNGVFIVFFLFAVCFILYLLN